MVGMLLCISFAIVSGLIVGYLLLLIAPKPTLPPQLESDDEKVSTEFHDKLYWSVAADYGRTLYTELDMLLKVPYC